MSVRVGRDRKSRFGKSGAARKLGLVQMIVEASAIRGGFRNTESCQPVSGWCYGSVLMGVWGGAVHPTAWTKIYANFGIWYVLDNLDDCGRMYTHSFRAANKVASTSPKYELGKVAFSSMFLKRKKSQRFGASSFSKFHHTRQKIPLPP